jgi:hypothetical protein
MFVQERLFRLCVSYEVGPAWQPGRMQVEKLFHGVWSAAEPGTTVNFPL